MTYEWRPIKGTGEILSWAIFHRKYFDDFPPPYNTIAVRLDEGPIVISNLIGPEPEGDWIGCRVEVVYEDSGGVTIPKMRLI
ncbi:Zn-ribbon domain-containing OB-fold protein [Microvirga alba]|nr:OB-fold domain-containing protein [Microvirga alba]